MDKTNTIELKNISKEYGETKVLDNINLYIRKNEFLTLLGPSGCGKTTTLRIIGGFEQPTDGKVIFEGKDITAFPPYERQINTVFQKYALFPHMNVFDNIAFGLKIKKTAINEIKTRVKEMLRLVNLKGFENRPIDSLSGGQQQRVAIARALVNEPKVLLLDEPLGALDLKLRKDMQIELKNMQKRIGITFIYVTHDQEEALTMSDTIAVMDKGKIQQIGTPVDIYNEPKNAFVAKFIGESNIVCGIMHEDFVVEFGGRIFKCVDKGFNKMENIDVVIRPEDLEIVPIEEGLLKGVVTSITFKGVHYEMIVKDGELEWMVHSTIMKPVGTEIGMKVLPENIHIMKRVMGE
ncbi:spermidine/putrescine ABC transporter ATP-binding protein [Schnuerera sp.]|uniref:spermidine/putrescine ABC transporter ATP-binding protein n=1 Tax=Schnuerera sp. TaxID=2794844 RepID=UPI002BFCC74F|nr:spermidine/putrescine ABC transporter ATP-binding protein [Schnuerera sp.]HSH36123.1 spermidine/putrescine ABC transporter ATP-binding protein [Schnuerera sp.]